MKKIIITIMAIFCVYLTQSQSYVGFLSDNYSGVHGIISNPANIVDSRFKADINMFSASVLATNDYYAASFGDVIKAAKDEIELKDLGTKSLLENNNAAVNIDILGPSFMFNLFPKHSIAISSRVRSLVNLNDVNGETFKLIDEKINDDKAYNIAEGNIRAAANVWAEIGISYATVLLNKKEHFLKGGITLKYLQGAGNAYGQGENIKVDYDPKGAVELGVAVPTLTSTGTVSYGQSDNFSDDFKKYEFKLTEGTSGFGADFGFIYEWRPEHDDYTYVDKETNRTFYYKDKNKYKLKIGVSVTDIGSIKNSEGTEKTYNLNETIKKQDYESGNIEEVLEKLSGLNKPTEGKAENFHLPTALHLDADWSINSKFYVNVNANFSVSGTGKNTGKIANSYTLTPRFESKWLSFYVPMGMYQYSGFQVGAGLRAGPLFVGSGSIISGLIGETKAADVYLGLKIPIYQTRPRDKDGDGVLDKIDKCPKVKGPIENNGCPWEDSDNDGVLDKDDKCPDVAGPTENNGCPWEDTDGDTILDKDDLCPMVVGPVENKGCPDTDKDGILDKDDKCPKIPGVAENSGCPKDTDGDGVSDNIDKCPTKVGPIENNGCPIEITKEDKAKLNSFAKAIYFNSGRTSFKPGVTEKLDLIVDIMNEYKESNFSIEGHTDSYGSRSTNLKLSKRRAKAVLDYLVAKGIDASRLSSTGYGESNPIASNVTRKGRAENRRVEIKLSK